MDRNVRSPAMELSHWLGAAQEKSGLCPKTCNRCCCATTGPARLMVLLPPALGALCRPQSTLTPHGCTSSCAFLESILQKSGEALFLRGNLKEGVAGTNRSPCHRSGSQDRHWYCPSFPFVLQFEFPSPPAITSTDPDGCPGGVTRTLIS